MKISNFPVLLGIFGAYLSLIDGIFSICFLFLVTIGVPNVFNILFRRVVDT